MYADDLMLLSISIRDLQFLVSMCFASFKELGMEININKSACLRIGLRHNAEVNDLSIDNNSLKWCQDFIYLGITIVSAKSFKINLQNMKHKFFRALNSIFSRVGTKTSPLLLCSLIDLCCLPILLYAAECFSWSSSMTQSVEFAYGQAFCKICKTSEASVIKSCQFYMGCLPLELRIVNRKFKFLKDNQVSTNPLTLLLKNEELDYKSMLIKYDIDNTNMSPATGGQGYGVTLKNISMINLFHHLFIRVCLCACASD